MILSPEAAEEVACEWMRWLGYADARRTPKGRDGGIDVVAAQAVAQVKAQMVKAGRPAMQQLIGVASRHHKQGFFFSLAGHTPEAVECGIEANVALFAFDLSGAATAVNLTARTLMHQAHLRGGAANSRAVDIEGFRTWVAAGTWTARRRLRRLERNTRWFLETGMQSNRSTTRFLVWVQQNHPWRCGTLMSDVAWYKELGTEYGLAPDVVETLF
jgi:hypothetical protein